ncbi:slipin family protein [Streptomyces sp. NPDC007164]|uniref:slipin family protein n=1 Tax=Streptomyces sp. NPDC007164 TaxID=3156918 RepID=UPI0033D8562E
MVQELVIAIVAAASAGALYTAAAAKVVKQYERGVVLRLGRLRDDVRGPGFTMVLPGIERLRKVNMQIVTMPVPAQDGITRDNVTVRVDAVIYFKVVDAASAVIQVEDYRFAVSQMAQTSLRSIIGKSDLDDLLSNREKLNQGLELMIDSPAVGWGVQIDRVEIKDVSLPETMKRSMARQAEADRERRARVINADAELQASKKLAEAAKEMSSQPAALQLRLLQTVVAVAAEKNSTLVLPFPVELLRFLERAQQPAQQPQLAQQPAEQPSARQQVAPPQTGQPQRAAQGQRPAQAQPRPRPRPPSSGASAPTPSPPPVPAPPNAVPARPSRPKPLARH